MFVLMDGKSAMCTWTLLLALSIYHEYFVSHLANGESVICIVRKILLGWRNGIVFASGASDPGSMPVPGNQR